jgi:uncharacterized protein (DUF1800 family)
MAMDRKDFLTTLSGSQRNGLKQKKWAAPENLVPFTGGIAPYTGNLTGATLIHLLNRTLFGATIEDLDYFNNKATAAIVDELIDTVDDPVRMGKPLKVYNPNQLNTLPEDADWGVAYGRTWVNTPTASAGVNRARCETLKAWWFNSLCNQSRSIESKMVLFWSTHLVTEIDTVKTGTLCYQYQQLLRQYATGNYKAFVKAITLNPAMLIYLNGYLNNKNDPDENYARELQELFTVGKGPGSGYTEDDVKAAARVLTGYQVNRIEARSFFNPVRHDTQPKTFSAFYNNTVINRPLAQGEQELDDLLDMIFAKEELARHICRRLYRFFVFHDISAETEANIITPLAATFQASNFELKPVLKQLLNSQHFFDVLQFGAAIKSPVDYLVGTIRMCGVKLPPVSNPQLLYRHIDYLGTNFLPAAEQDLGDPGSVAGYPAYHQEPLLDKSWINTNSFAKRQALMDVLINNGYSNGGFKTIIDAVAVARRMSDPSDPNILVQDFNQYFLPRTLSNNLLQSIKKDILLTGQDEDYYWTTAWDMYQLNPADLNNYSVVNSRLKNLLQYFLTRLEEYHLM